MRSKVFSGLLILMIVLLGLNLLIEVYAIVMSYSWSSKLLNLTQQTEMYKSLLSDGIGLAIIVWLLRRKKWVYWPAQIMNAIGIIGLLIYPGILTWMRVVGVLLILVMAWLQYSCRMEFVK